MKYCKNCGKEIIPGGDICLGCGKPIDNKKINNQSGKSKNVAGLLAIFLGTIGANNFYLGQTKRAIAKILLTVVMFILVITSVVVYAVEYEEYQVEINNQSCNYYYTYNDCNYIEEPSNVNIYYVLGTMLSFGLSAWSITEGILIFSGKINKDSKGNLLV